VSVWRQLARGLRVLTRRGAADRDLADEVEHYLEQSAAERIAKGASPDQARRAARLELGNMTVVREQVRAGGWENSIATALADLRHAARRMSRQPGFTAICALVLALGIGASTAIFSVVHPILFESLPYPHAERVVAVWDDAAGGGRLAVTFGTHRELVERSHSFESIAVTRAWQPTMTGQVEPERLDGQRVSAAYFDVLGVAPALGRDLEASDDRLAGAKVVILGHGLWQRRFGGDVTIVGSTIPLDGDAHLVIGVMPAGFENILAPSAELWAPLQYDDSLPHEGREWGHHLRMVARLRAGIGPEQAEREVGTIARDPVAAFARPAWAALDGGLAVRPLQDDVTDGARPVLLAILGAVLLVLAIACVNVTNLVLAQGARRRGEFALRAALGAGRARMMRQLLTESLLLAGIGGALGLAVAEFGVRAVVALSPPGLPRVDAIRIDGAVFAFATGITALIGLAVGLIPALQAARQDPRAGLQQGSQRTTGGNQWTRRALVVAEVALALVLLVSAGLLVRSLQRLVAVSPGFEPASGLTMQVQTAGRQFGQRPDDVGPTHRFFEQALAAVRQVPGVEQAAFTSQLPLSGDLDTYGVQLEHGRGDESADGAFRYAVTPGYLETMGIPLRSGRRLDERDTAGAVPAVVISESLARRQFPGRDPLGQRVHIGPTDRPWYTVVGVVGDVKQTSLAADPSDAVYIASAQWPFTDRAMSLVVRARGNPAALTPAIRRAIWSVDSDQPIVRVATMEELVAATTAEKRFASILFEFFGLAALLLAATGIYGVLAGSVSERTREIGVRLALGATPRVVLGLVLRQGMTLTALGLVIGLGGAVAASRALAALLYRVSPLDPITYLGVIALLAAVSLAACVLPARRAARLHPSIALRSE
jgi:putative ABC transport system permease protein